MEQKPGDNFNDVYEPGIKLVFDEGHELDGFADDLVKFKSVLDFLHNSSYPYKDSLGSAWCDFYHGEWGIAAESVCGGISELGLPIPIEIFTILKTFIIEWDMDLNYVTEIEHLVQDAA